MICGKLEKRLYLIGGKPQLVVHGDVSEALEVVEIEYVRYREMVPVSGAIHIFILGGKIAEVARVEIPREASIIFSSRYVVIKSDTAHRYGEWYGKAGTVIDLRNRQGVISVPGLRYFNKDFVSRMIFRPVLDRLFFECGYIPLHAAGVLSGGMGCIIVGETGSGKSTLLYGLVESGKGFLGDDRILVVNEGESSPCIHSFPEHIRLPITESGPKHTVLPPDSPFYRASPKVILFLKKGKVGGRTSCKPIESAEAAARLLQFIPPFMEEHMCEKAFNLIGELCGGAKSFMVKGGEAPQKRLQSVIQILEENIGIEI